jgi:hypothetical protein
MAHLEKGGLKEFAMEHKRILGPITHKEQDVLAKRNRAHLAHIFDEWATASRPGRSGP